MNNPKSDQTSIRVICRSGIEGGQGRLQGNYDNFSEFKSFCETFGLHKKLGYKTSAACWKANPLIQWSVNPDDFRKITLPADPENMNEARATWARAALQAFMIETGQDEEPEALGDLVADLLHLGDRIGLPAATLLDRAAYNYAEDTRLE